jgi:hypothetical protein
MLWQSASTFQWRPTLRNFYSVASLTPAYRGDKLTGDRDTRRLVGVISPWSLLLVTTPVRVQSGLCSVMRWLAVKSGVERECSSSNLRHQHLRLNIHRLSTAQKKNPSPATILHNIQNLRTQLFRELFTYFPCPVAGRHFQKFKTPKNRFPANENRGNWTVSWENSGTGNMVILLGL